MRAIPLVVLMSACAPSVVLEQRALEQGGTFDVRRCGAGPQLEPVLPTHDVSLAICGDLRSDNTTTVTGDVRVQGTTRVSSPVNISGSLFTGDSVECPNTLNVSGDFSTSGNWTVSSPANVNGNATIGGTLRHDNSVNVGGTLNVLSADGPGALNVGTLLNSPGDVAAPINCANAPDVHAIAERLDDVDPWLQADRRFVISQPTELVFGCGRYVMNGFETNNTLTVRIVGPTQLVIRGSMRIAAPTRFIVENGARLELIIDGALNVDNTLDIDNAIVAVSGDVRIASPTNLNGLLLAPRSNISLDNTLDVNGSMFVGTTRVASPLVIHR